MIKRVFAIVLLAVLASVVFGLCTVFGVTSDHAAVVSRAMQDKAEMVAPVNLPPSSVCLDCHKSTPTYGWKKYWHKKLAVKRIERIPAPMGIA